MNATDIAIIIAAVGNMLIGLVTAWKMTKVQSGFGEVKSEVSEVKKQTDGLKDELVRAARRESHAEGVQEQRENSQQATDRDDRNFERGAKSEKDKR